MESEKFRQFYEAASKLFIQQGYGNTVVGDITKLGGFAVGTFYAYFTGKKAIKYFVLKCVVDPEYMLRDHNEPINEDLAIGLDDEIMGALDSIINKFSAHLEDRAQNYTFEDLISDAYDLMARYAVGCLFIEKNPKECGKLAEYYKQYRVRFFSSMLNYLNLFIERGEVRPVKHPQYTVNLIIETISWWAMDRRYNSFESPEIPEEVAKEVVLDNLVTAYKHQK